MPSPIGHALGGIAAGWSADMTPGDRYGSGGLTLAFALLGAAPDLDLLFTSHRTFTHSLGAVIFVALFCGAIAANARRPVLRVALLCAAAYGSHLFLDWLGADTSSPRGLQIFWPFDQGWYMSGVNVFRQTERRAIWSSMGMRTNAIAILQEIAVLGPTVVALNLARQRGRRRSRPRDTA